MRSVILLFFLFCIQSCQKNDVPWPGCEHIRKDGWYIETTLNNVTGRVIRGYFPDSTSRFLLSLDTGPSQTVAPCNLPEAFKADSMRVRVSGNIYTHPLMDVDYLPAELRAIELLD